MTTTSRANSAPGDRLHSDGGLTALPRMLFRATQDVISRALVRAVADCYIDYRVDLVSQLPGDLDGVALVAFQLDPEANAEADVGKVRRLYPGAVLTALVGSPAQVPPGIEELVGRGQLQGVVPLTLSLSLWLAAFGLLLNGGIYLPPGILLRPEVNDSPVTPGEADDNGQGPPEAGYQEELTNREQEVLRLLSMGFQNKIIASRMNLSEYTVKVHVHNIIRKLHVHNRTQAAAYWLGNGPRRPDNRSARSTGHGRNQ